MLPLGILPFDFSCSIPSKLVYYFKRICTMWYLPYLFCCISIFHLHTCFIFSSLWVPWQLPERQQEVMVWSSAWREIYLHIDKSIYFSYLSFNFTCFEQTEFLPVISWFWKFYVPIWAPTHFPEVICFRYNPVMVFQSVLFSDQQYLPWQDLMIINMLFDLFEQSNSWQ